MRRRNRLLVAGVALFSAACGSTGISGPAGDLPTEEAEPSKGRILYLVHCVTCHGDDGRLGASGAKILPDTKLDHAAIVTQITRGKGLMTAFEGILSPAEIDSVASYVETLKSTPGL